MSRMIVDSGRGGIVGEDWAIEASLDGTVRIEIPPSYPGDLPGAKRCHKLQPDRVRLLAAAFLAVAEEVERFREKCP